jgi:hypothetical protein
MFADDAVGHRCLEVHALIRFAARLSEIAWNPVSRTAREHEQTERAIVLGATRIA